ncbi:hypothetical protein LEWO105114_12575 [Legionella worsleiensis]
MYVELDICINGKWNLDTLNQRYLNDKWNPMHPEKFIEKYGFEPFIITDKRIHAFLANVYNIDEIPYICRPKGLTSDREDDVTYDTSGWGVSIPVSTYQEYASKTWFLLSELLHYNYQRNITIKNVTTSLESYLGSSYFTFLQKIQNISPSTKPEDVRLFVYFGDD